MRVFDLTLSLAAVFNVRGTEKKNFAFGGIVLTKGVLALPGAGGRCSLSLSLTDLQRLRRFGQTRLLRSNPILGGRITYRGISDVGVTEAFTIRGPLPPLDSH